jgi:hypothetical protein
MGERRPAQFILSLSGGILILAGGLLSLAWIFVDIPQSFDPLVQLRQAVGEEEFRLFQVRYTVAGLSSGIAVILTSFMLKTRPQESKRWGIMIIVLSAMSVLGMGGFVVGMALGIAGGIMAVMRAKSLAERPEAEETKTREREPTSMIYICSTCRKEFSSDEDLKRHLIDAHYGN